MKIFRNLWGEPNFRRGNFRLWVFGSKIFEKFEIFEFFWQQNDQKFSQKIIGLAHMRSVKK